MKTSPWRFRVKLIDAGVLARYMEFRDETVRSLADKVGCSHSTIGHLRSGRRNTLDNQEWAKKIEVLLNAPPGSLFAPEVSRVSENAA